ncbi:hypothetical protein F5883DRAFT_537383 [Diaporthe sp. PMI_573]|nr:hypothetical protein F5883DRAFT_537383 [Diaporthaceae sp. PMI_573]
MTRQQSLRRPGYNTKSPTERFFFLTTTVLPHFVVPLPPPGLGLVQSRHHTVFALSLVHTFAMLCILVQYYVYPTKRMRQSQPGWVLP